MLVGKYSIIVLAGLSIFFTFSSQPAYAHVLKSDGSVGAVVHVSPEDDPIAGEPTDFFFEFKDTTGKFTPEKCDCRGIILQDGEEIYSVPLFQNSPNPSLETASFSFTFPGRNVYKVRVQGKPTTQGAFEPFMLTWDIRVARESESQPAEKTQQGGLVDWTSRHTPHLIGAFIIAGIFLYALIRQHRSGRIKHT